MGGSCLLFTLMAPVLADGMDRDLKIQRQTAVALVIYIGGRALVQNFLPAEGDFVESEEAGADIPILPLHFTDRSASAGAGQAGRGADQGEAARNKFVSP
jgi:hypothetical protein